MNEICVGDVVKVDIGYDVVFGKVIKRLDDEDYSWVMVIMPDGSAWLGETNSPELRPVVH